MPPFARCPVYATLRCFLARQYRGTRLTSLETGRLFAAFLTAGCLPLTDFFREPENGGEKQKAGMKTGLSQFAVESAQ
ncbi:hypothetical protein V1279_006230 [Bradyrhizobium sp. AZCC 1610]|uniref:hypothetical protein n=1 Tax=Bradyrhizobium sp. AZCC 1610 TaxID=3117020 RepID=UPI002FF02C48